MAATTSGRVRGVTEAKSSSRRGRDMTPLWQVYLLLTITVRLHAQSNFVEPVEASIGVDYYEFENDRYGIYTQYVTWEEANQICPTRNGTLVNFEAPGLPEFIARALAESAVGFGTLWIGGKLVKNCRNCTKGTWTWTGSNHIIDSTLANVTSFPMEVPPFWVNRPIDDSDERLCLGTDRRLHHLPLIVPVVCDKLRPFICKQKIENTGATVEVIPPLTIKGKKFHLFQAQATWAEALSQCQVLGMKLAKVTLAIEFKQIGNRMLRARPVIESAWIGGFVDQDSTWRWTSSNEPINVDMAKKTPEKPFPWYRPEEIIYEGCLLADRHVCNRFAYVEAKCDRRRPFICEQELVKKVEPPMSPVVNTTLWVSNYMETWERAQNVCKYCLDGHLLEIRANKETVTTVLPILYSAMAISVKTEVRHAWIGGYLFQNKDFRWTNDSKIDPSESETLKADEYNALRNGGELGLLEYCNVSLVDEPYLLKYKCLNLDRENQKNFFMYGLNCDLKQYFLCQARVGASLAEECAILSEHGAPKPQTDTTTKKTA